MFENWAASLDLDPSKVKKMFKFDSFYDNFERGMIGKTAYYEHVNAILGGGLSYDDFIKGWNSIYKGVIPGIPELIERLVKNYMVVALTNTNEIHHPVWKELYRDVFKKFEKIYTSYELKMRKPEKRLFRYILQTCGVTPRQALFLDDLDVNISAASSLGINCIKVDSPESIAKGLKMRLEKITL